MLIFFQVQLKNTVMYFTCKINAHFVFGIKERKEDCCYCSLVNDSILSYHYFITMKGIHFILASYYLAYPMNFNFFSVFIIFFSWEYLFYL